MGGWGSTRWTFHTRKTRTSECARFSINDLFPLGVDKGVVHKIAWEVPPGNKCIASMTYLLGQDANRVCSIVGVIRFSFSRKTLPVDVDLTYTKCNNYGGVRWWLQCPSCVSIETLARRKYLYIHPHLGLIGCRVCLDLSYPTKRRSRRLFAS